jgi:hypothetical protein
VGQDAFDEIASFFPEVADKGHSLQAVRLIPRSGKQALTLVHRNLKNGKPFVGALTEVSVASQASRALHPHAA